MSMIDTKKNEHRLRFFMNACKVSMAENVSLIPNASLARLAKVVAVPSGRRIRPEDFAWTHIYIAIFF